MPVKIKLPRAAIRWIEKRLQLPEGSVIRPPQQLALRGRTLMYFKSRACVACKDIDLFIGQIAREHHLDLRVLDASAGDLPEQAYGGDLLLDRSAELHRAYRVRVHPTLIITGPDGVVEKCVLGGDPDKQLMTRKLGLIT